MEGGGNRESEEMGQPALREAQPQGQWAGERTKQDCDKRWWGLGERKGWWEGEKGSHGPQKEGTAWWEFFACGGICGCYFHSLTKPGPSALRCLSLRQGGASVVQIK